ncbi:MAG: histone deacetylase family protein [Woeseiaceae bacterium]|nr:histone deacetylase family protein [Woeseiaceae bacterium]
MRTAYITHPACQQHDTGPAHPECASRIYAIEDQFISTGLRDALRYVDAPEATAEQLLRVHTPAHLESVSAMIPDSGYARLDPDTIVSPNSLAAAYRAAGAVVAAVDLVATGEMDSAFCAVRPPGHHAESDRAMGFCLFNNIAVGAAHALEAHGIGKVAILDFDVHQGNGTEEIFAGDERVMFCSTFQHPFFPFTPVPPNNANRVNVTLDATAKSEEFRAAVTEHWIPALERFQPEMIFVSAGFDAHVDDDMSHVSLTDADYRWVAAQIVDIASRSASGRIVSTLEGGYELNSLARCVETHVRVLMGIETPMAGR